MKRHWAAWVGVACALAPVALLQAQQTPPQPQPGVRWTEDQLLKAVAPVRAGRKLTPKAWPNRSRVAVCLSFDDDNESYLLASGNTSPTTLSTGDFGAQEGLPRILALLDKYPLIREQMHAAVLVAERRWNVVLKNGIDVRLPGTDAAKALDTLVQLDRDNKLLSRDITVVDLRLADRVTVRLADEPAAARLEAIKAKNKKKGGAA